MPRKATTIERCTDQAIVSVMTSEGDVRGTEAAVEVLENGTVRLQAGTMQMLRVRNGDVIGVTPLREFAREVQFGGSGGDVKVPAKRKRMMR